MKKYFVVVLSIAMVLLSGVALAADALYRMLHTEEVPSFRKDQSAMIVGQIMGHPKGNYEVKVLKVLSGKVSDENILLKDDFNYSWSKVEATPKLMDYCVISMLKVGRTYQKAWGVFQADGEDYKTLKLTALKVSPVLSSDLAAIQWYVNSGGIEKEFSFSEDKVFVKRSDGSSIQIYPETNPGPKKVPVNLNPSGETTAQTQSPIEDPNGTKINLLEGVLIAINGLGLGLMGYDKLKAKSGGWRIPELYFFAIGLVGGATGVYAGMRLFRHKTRTRTFVIGIPLLAVLNFLMVRQLEQWLG